MFEKLMKHQTFVFVYALFFYTELFIYIFDRLGGNNVFTSDYLLTRVLGAIIAGVMIGAYKKYKSRR